jgi:hypothetical protein
MQLARRTAGRRSRTAPECGREPAPNHRSARVRAAAGSDAAIEAARRLLVVYAQQHRQLAVTLLVREIVDGTTVR